MNENSPAAQAGLEKGDEILRINDKETLAWQDVLTAVKDSTGSPLSIVVQRGGEQLTMTVKPSIDAVKNVFGEEVEQRYMIGIMKADDVTWEPSGLLASLENAFLQTWMYIDLTATGFVKIIQQVGIGLLGTLMIFVFYNDIVRLFH